MGETAGFCLVCWFVGSLLLAGAWFDWGWLCLSYLSAFSWGRTFCRIFNGLFGLVLIGVGFMIVLASG